MKKLITSTALALVLGLGAAPTFSPAVLAQEAAICSDFGVVDADDDDILSETEYTAFGEGVFGDWDGDDDDRVSAAEFNDCYEAGGWYESGLDDEWEADSNELYAAWDDDADGLLTQDEFFDDEEFGEWDADDDADIESQEFLIDNFLF